MEKHIKLRVILGSTTRDNKYLKLLIESLNRFGYDYELFIGDQFKWNQGNYPVINDWIREHYTHILFTDSFDTVALGSQQELIEKYLKLSPNADKWIYSVEKNCVCDEYKDAAKSNSPWKHLNCGGYIAPISLYDERISNTNSLVHKDDMRFSANEFYDNNQGKILIDDRCEIFQTLFMEERGDFAFTRDGRIMNRVTNTLPVIIHANGSGNREGYSYDWIYEWNKSPFN